MRSQRYEHAPVHKRLDVVFRSTVNSRFSNGGFPRCEKPIRIGNIFFSRNIEFLPQNILVRDL